MKALVVCFSLATTSLAFAQPAPAPGSAAAPAPGSAAPAPADPVAPPSVDLGQETAACDAALANPPGGDRRFVNDVQYSARGWVSSEELAKSKAGRSCMQAIAGVDTARSKYSTAADTRDAAERVEATRLQHEGAAAAIAKNEKHVVLAYAALWVLSAGFLMFLWKRQQGLKTEIAQLKRELDAAAKE
jgi:hypothetical protein